MKMNRKLPLVLLVVITMFGYSQSEGNVCTNKGSYSEYTDPRLHYKVIKDDFENPDIDIEEIIKEITTGKGFVMLPQLFSEKDITHARELTQYLIKTQGNKATHFQGTEDEQTKLQARVWNMLDKGQIYEKMVQHPIILKIMRQILGDDAQLGSIASNTLFPGGAGQEPHLDYPYWDYYNKGHWPQSPKHPDIPFFMNFQATILLDDFTAENGATGVRPGTQLKAEWPHDTEEFHRNVEQGVGKAGDVMVFVGLLQHCAMDNKSNNTRTGILLQYLPKYVRPMEDIKRSISDDVIERLSPELKKLLLWDYPYPALLDKAEAKSTEGSKSDFKWKD